jgi:hypothetical protein
LRSWHGNGRAIIELENHTFARWSGDPIQHEQELEDLIPPGQNLDRARRWWEHRDDPVEMSHGVRVGWINGVLRDLDNDMTLTTYQQVLAAFPEPGPFQDAALQWVARQQQAVRTPGDFGESPDVPFVMDPHVTTPPLRSAGAKRDNQGKFLGKNQKGMSDA